MSAHRPSVADFLVYYRVAEDGEILRDKPWVLIDKENEIPSDENPADFSSIRISYWWRRRSLNPMNSIHRIPVKSCNENNIIVLRFQ
jgi:hypothetical protein